MAPPKRGPKFAVTPEQAIADHRLSKNDYRLLMLLGKRAGAADWTCIIKQSTLAADLHLSIRSVNRLVQHLVDFGYLTIDHRFGEDGAMIASRYTLHAPRDQAELFEGPPTTGLSGGPPTAGVVGPTTPGVVPITTLSSNEESLSHSGARSRSRSKAHRHPLSGQRELLPPQAVGVGDWRPAAGEADRAPRMTGDWVPSEIDRAYAARAGLSPAEVDSLAERFRDWHLDKGDHRGRSADWPARWRKWVRDEVKQLEEKRGQERRNTGGRRQAEAERLAAAFASFGGRGRPPSGAG